MVRIDSGLTIPVADTKYLKLDCSNDPLTGDLALTSSTNDKPLLELINTSGGLEGPNIEFYHNSATPGDDDDLGVIGWWGKDFLGNKTNYAYLKVESADVTNGTEDGYWELGGLVGGFSYVWLKNAGLDIILPNDSQKLALGAAGSTDSYLQFGGINLEYYSSGAHDFGAGNITTTGEYQLGGNTALAVMDSTNYFLGTTDLPDENDLPDDGENIFIGYRSGYNPSSAAAKWNVCIGYETGYSLTYGDWNALIGYRAGRKINTGSGNMFIGTYSGYDATSGSYNVGIGYYSLHELSTTSNNVGIGSEAGRNTTGAGNIFIGYSAGKNQAAVSNYLIFDNQARADAATELTHAIIYGIMGANPEDQTLIFNTDDVRIRTDTTADPVLTMEGSTNTGTITYDESDDEFDYGSSNLTTAGTVGGGNFTGTDLEFLGGGSGNVALGNGGSDSGNLDTVSISGLSDDDHLLIRIWTENNPDDIQDLYLKDGDGNILADLNGVANGRQFWEVTLRPELSDSDDAIFRYDLTYNNLTDLEDVGTAGTTESGWFTGSWTIALNNDWATVSAVTVYWRWAVFKVRGS